MKNGLLILLAFFSLEVGRASSIRDVLGPLPVQDGGRFKPFDTFARESLQLVYGRKAWKEKSATEVVMTWLLVADHWDSVEFVKIDRKDLKSALNLNLERSHYSPVELFQAERLPLLMQDLASRRKAQEKLDPFYQSIETLENQLSLYKAITAGTVLKVVPVAGQSGWMELAQTQGPVREKFDQITQAFVAAIETKDTQSLQTAVQEFNQLAKAQDPSNYPSERMIEVEMLHNKYQPFLYAWILYLISALGLIVALLSGRSWAAKLGWSASILGFLLHTVGFGVRMYLTGRPPVSNMYESVIWVSWGALVFAMIFEILQKRKFYLLSANVLSVLCLIVADIAPNVLDPTLQPLQPVLRSNFWLTIHVLTITLSYSAFFLAFILGDIGLFYFLRGEKEHQAQVHGLALAIYKVLQVGVVLLFAGTVLGGVWADYSWGRFWGWDPKETWAFIALMGYIAILHGRLAGWLKTFGFTAASVIAFALVIMAWYGVNFVLGAGLHSYGFGAGGVEYVAAFVGLHILYVVFVTTVRQSRLSQSSKAS